MSKSLKRVEANAQDLGLDIEIINTPDGTHTAQMAADFCGCDVGQIAKSIIFRADDSLIMFITSGAKRVDPVKASEVAGKALSKADAAIIREITGFAIGGVSPLGSLNPITQYFDETLLTYPKVFAAAGTPHHLFEVEPKQLCDALGCVVAHFTE